ncbi:unnamed protein product [Amoebophrya sp. A120]|nr:unnamed protein product [Amoebophrya sp. A120]|eukprot:GSA120T00003948001.1
MKNSLALDTSSYDAFWQQFITRLWLAFLESFLLEENFNGLEKLSKQQAEFFAHLIRYGKEILDFLYARDRGEDVEAEPEEGKEKKENEPQQEHQKRSADLNIPEPSFSPPRLPFPPPCPPEPPYSELQRFLDTCLPPVSTVGRKNTGTAASHPDNLMTSASSGDVASSFSRSTSEQHQFTPIKRTESTSTKTPLYAHENVESAGTVARTEVSLLAPSGGVLTSSSSGKTIGIAQAQQGPHQQQFSLSHNVMPGSTVSTPQLSPPPPPPPPPPLTVGGTGAPTRYSGETGPVPPDLPEDTTSTASSGAPWQGPVSRLFYCELLFYLRTLFAPSATTSGGSSSGTSTATSSGKSSPNDERDLPPEVTSTATTPVHLSGVLNTSSTNYLRGPSEEKESTCCSAKNSAAASAAAAPSKWKMVPVVNILLSLVCFPGFGHYLLHCVIARQTHFLDHADNLIRGVQQILTDVYELEDEGAAPVEEDQRHDLRRTKSRSGGEEGNTGGSMFSPLLKNHYRNQTGTATGIFFLVLQSLFHYLNASVVHKEIKRQARRKQQLDELLANGNEQKDARTRNINLPTEPEILGHCLDGRTRAGSYSSAHEHLSSDSEVVLHPGTGGRTVSTHSTTTTAPTTSRSLVEMVSSSSPRKHSQNLSSGASASAAYQRQHLRLPQDDLYQPSQQPHCKNSLYQSFDSVWQNLFLLSSFPFFGKKDQPLDYFLKALRDTLPVGNYPAAENLLGFGGSSGSAPTSSFQNDGPDLFHGHDNGTWLLSNRDPPGAAAHVAGAAAAFGHGGELVGHEQPPRRRSSIHQQTPQFDRYAFAKQQIGDVFLPEEEDNIPVRVRHQRLQDFIRIVRRVLEAIFFHRALRTRRELQQGNAAGASTTSSSAGNNAGTAGDSSTTTGGLGYQQGRASGIQRKSSKVLGSSGTSTTASPSTTPTGSAASSLRLPFSGSAPAASSSSILVQNARLSNALFPMYEEVAALLEANQTSGGLWTITGLAVNVYRTAEIGRVNQVPVHSYNTSGTTSSSAGAQNHAATIKKPLTELRAGDRVRFLKWCDNADPFLEDLRIMRELRQTQPNWGTSAATASGGASTSNTPVSTGTAASSAETAARMSTPIAPAVVAGGPQLLAASSSQVSWGRAAGAAQPEPYRRENLVSMLACLPSARIVCVDQGVVGWIRVADLVSSFEVQSAGGSSTTTSSQQHLSHLPGAASTSSTPNASPTTTTSASGAAASGTNSGAPPRGKVRLQLQVRDEHLFEHVVDVSQGSAAGGSASAQAQRMTQGQSALRRARMFMEESTLLRILRVYLEDIILDDIKGEAEGLKYELSELTFPSLNTTRCFCHLKSCANPPAASATAQLQRTITLENEHDVNSKQGTTTTKYFSITVKNLGLVMHHKWKASGTLLRLEGENIVDVKDSRAEFVFAVSVREGADGGTDGTACADVDSKRVDDVEKASGGGGATSSSRPNSNALKVRIASASIELGELELAIANHDDAENKNFFNQAWTTLVFGTLRRVLQRALAGQAMRERLQSLLCTLLQEKAFDPLDSATSLQRVIPGKLATTFLCYLHKNLPPQGVQL